MENIRKALDSVVPKISDGNYEQSFAFYRFWFDIGQTYRQIPADLTFDTILNNRAGVSIKPELGELVHTTAHLITRFASDAESDPILTPHTAGLQSRLCTRVLQGWFDRNLGFVEGVETGSWDNYKGYFYGDINLIAHWANLGYVEEATIHNHILQSLISHPKLYDHQADALIILFKLAGATFGAYADPSIVDRCFKLLKWHYSGNPVKRKLVQEVVLLREHGWEGLPPPPVFTPGKPKPGGVNQKDPAATPVATFLGLPSRDPEPQIPQSPPFDPVVIPETGTSFPVTPVTQSPSTSIASLSDFAIEDTSDDEPPTDTAIANAPDNEPPTDDPTAIAPHETFYLQDGNVEVLCGNTLFRVHTSVLSFHSPALHRMLAQTRLDTAESPNGCPRILSSDTATDFATLLKMVYLPGFPEKNRTPDFATFSSLLQITTRYEMPAIRSQLLDLIRGAYPESFEGLTPSKPLGESVFSGPTPHPNAVLNLFVQEKLTSALPMAYYMAARRGVDSLMDRHLPRNSTLHPKILQSAIKGFVALREVELNETHRLVFGPNASNPCFTSNCPSRAPTGPGTLEAYQKIFDRIVGSSQFGTKVLQVPELYEDRGGELKCVGSDICSSCVERWGSGHADLRKKVWAMLPDVFGLQS